MTAFQQDVLPEFDKIRPEQIEEQVYCKLDENRKKLDSLLAQPKPYTWKNLMLPLEEMSDAFQQFWSPVSHLHGTMESEALRKAYNAALPLITKYHTELSQNENLFNAISSIANSETFAALEPAQKKIIENDIRDFKLAGIHLPADKKLQIAELQQRLSKLMTLFSENLLDATNAWTLQVTDVNDIKGLPPQAVQLALANAKKRSMEGYVFTLEYPSYSTAIKFLENRGLRKTLHEAYVTRASNCGPNAGKWDNTGVMNEILEVRHQLANLIGFSNFAEYSLATKMAKTPAEVLDFLNDLLVRSKPIAIEEHNEMAGLAKQDGITELKAWDIPYYSEKLSKTIFDFTQEDLRPYFPVDKVMQGMFAIVNKIYGVSIQENKNISTWHTDVKFFSVYDDKQTLRGGFYIDLYARPHKRDGAWMDECRIRRLKQDKKLQHPVAYLTCNFMQPVAGQPALLTHDDVLTLFHEFGHCLHHILTTVNYAPVSGINGVPWDAVEFPSQIMENFCWEKEPLALISGHFQTGDPLPKALYQKMLDAKHFQTGLQMLRQIEFSLFDFRLHLEYEKNKPNFIQSMLNDIRTQTAIARVPEFNRFQHSFAHIFAGSYAAGYYSYKWAEVLSSDAYSKFEEHGILDRSTGFSFMENILEVGGVKHPMEAFIAFRGREPKIDALLRLSGITKGETA